MCCLFGVIDYKNTLTAKEKNRLVSALATAAEARGTDATGIAYNSAGKLRIYKRPWPGHCMRFLVPQDAPVIMGHTRMTTQGNEKKNFNNHPFSGSADGHPFALAHNGMLYNDHRLRQSLRLPATNIETDSYIAVQLLEHKNALDFNSLRYMAEQVEGSFCFTVLADTNALYIIRGDNPLCLFHFKHAGVYVYASTEEILRKALSKAKVIRETPKPIEINCGDILRIDADGQITRDQFNTSRLFSSRYYFRPYSTGWDSLQLALDDETDLYLDELKAVATAFGYTPEMIDRLVARGFTPEDIEELLYA